MSSQTRLHLALFSKSIKIGQVVIIYFLYGRESRIFKILYPFKTFKLKKKKDKRWNETANAQTREQTYSTRRIIGENVLLKCCCHLLDCICCCKSIF